MCWRRKPPVKPPIEQIPGKSKTALLFGINDYQGTGNDLNGCLNDGRDVENILNTMFPGFLVKRFTDSDVTTYRFITEVTEAIKKLVSGDILLIHYSGHGTQVYDRNGDETDKYDEALYLYNGTVIDDDIAGALNSIPDGATVILMFDSCFSGGATRSMLNRSRCIPISNYDGGRKKLIRIPREEMKYIYFSACQENQTSSDAFINGEYHGAFTFYALKALMPGITYNQWYTRIRTLLPNTHFSQIPSIEGREELLNKIVFTN